MKRYLWLASCLLTVAIIGSASWAQETTHKAKKEPTSRKQDGFTGDYAIMVSELKLTDKQQEQLRIKIQAKQEALKAWARTEDGKKLAQLRKESEAARTAKDKEQVNTLREQIAPLESQREKISRQKQQELLSILTVQQRADWDVSLLYRAMLRHFSKAKIENDQRPQIKKLCKDAEPELAKLKGDQREDSKAWRQFRDGMINKITKTVLTEDQRKEMAAPASRPSHRTRK